jgi:hypothetical protein
MHRNFPLNRPIIIYSPILPKTTLKYPFKISHCQIIKIEAPCKFDKYISTQEFQPRRGQKSAHQANLKLPQIKKVCSPLQLTLVVVCIQSQEYIKLTKLSVSSRKYPFRSPFENENLRAKVEHALEIFEAWRRLAIRAVSRRSAPAVI